MKYLEILICILCAIDNLPQGQVTSGEILLIVVTEKNQTEWITKFSTGLNRVQNGSGFKFILQSVEISPFNVDGLVANVCSVASAKSVSGIIDLTWGGLASLKNISQSNGVPYIRIETSNYQFIQASDNYLRSRGGIDAALIFKTNAELDQSMAFLLGNSFVRVLVVSLEETDGLERLSRMRPSPNFYVAQGDTKTILEIYRLAKSKNLAKRDSRWNLVFHDWNWTNFANNELESQATLFTLQNEACCSLINSSAGYFCNCKSVPKPAEVFVENSGFILGMTITNLANRGSQTSSSFVCTNLTASTTKFNEIFVDELVKVINTSSKYLYDKEKNLMTYPLLFNISTANATDSTNIGTWSYSKGFVGASNFSRKASKRYFRIGVVPLRPWTFYKRNDKGEKMMDKYGNPILQGYCVDFAQKLAGNMGIDFDLIVPTDNSEDFGYRKPDGNWTGLMRDLVTGSIDIAIAAMTMTSERAEAVDFVAPYFDQTGISIITRVPVKQQSLFKFLDVLDIYVWLSIAGAVIATALLLWFFDRFSPYSARNNRSAHPFPCRKFTLSESFWFSLTSFTPQGGGESPRCYSGRILVSAYWVFVVLMLATFTANLAAFLTVERLATTVKDLAELTKQTAISYTVVANSSFYEYFKNMAGAEEELYKVWKNLTLTGKDSENSRYRVWDYPIKEQYTKMFEGILKGGPVNSSTEGFRRVLSAENGSFAFIHDAKLIRYEYFNNCNFTEIGEQFGEQPYAVAVQQGSHLQEEISIKILELQKERYFETISAFYWNNDFRSQCPTIDDSNGITLTSLSGVFISIVFGLFVALLALGFEVYFGKRKEKKTAELSSPVSDIKRMQIGGRIITVRGDPNAEFTAQYVSPFDY